MRNLKTNIRVSFGLCLCSGIALLISNLALMDIRHGESDVTLEWRILQISYPIFILFHVSAFITLARLMKWKNIGKTEA